MSLLPSAAAADAGRALYERGLASNGAPVSARSGAQGTWILRGASVACANCHGVDGAGGGEGRAAAPSLRWTAWASPQPERRAAARERLRAAVLRGRGADGRALSAAMPRYDLSEPDFEALARHVESLALGPAAAPRPRFALLSPDGALATAFDTEFDAALTRCLQTRIGERAAFETGRFETAEQAQTLWREWARRADVVAAIGPAWRAWRPDEGEDEPRLPALFPRALDALPATGGVDWLLGDWEARAAVLVAAWLAATPVPRPALAVWAPGAEAQSRLAALPRIAEAVQRSTGQPLRWRIGERPEDHEGAGLWLDPLESPRAGTWLAPLASRPPPGSAARLWLAAPYSGTGGPSLAQRWAHAACITLEAALTEAPAVQRHQWSGVLWRLPRLRDGQGWDWHLASPEEAAEYGAMTSWTVAEFGPSGLARVIEPRLDLSRPQRRSHAAGAAPD